VDGGALKESFSAIFDLSGAYPHGPHRGLFLLLLRRGEQIVLEQGLALRLSWVILEVDPRAEA